MWVLPSERVTLNVYPWWYLLFLAEKHRNMGEYLGNRKGTLPRIPTFSLWWVKVPKFYEREQNMERLGYLKSPALIGSDLELFPGFDQHIWASIFLVLMNLCTILLSQRLTFKQYWGLLWFARKNIEDLHTRKDGLCYNSFKIPG